MNKRITKIWCVGLVVAVLASLLIVAAPVSAKPLSFTKETIPTDTNYILATTNIGEEVTDIAVSADGDNIYASGGTGTLVKSTTGGYTWGKIETDAGPEINGVTDGGQIDADLVAVAPDDPDVVAIVQVTGPDIWVYVSTNGGTTWGSLGQPTTSAASLVTDLAVSASYSGNNYIAVAGFDGTNGKVWTYKLGIGGSWTQADTNQGFNNVVDGAAIPVTIPVLAVEFSPNFASDQVLTALVDNTVDTSFEMYSVNLEEWNLSAGFENYPVVLQDNDSGSVTGATQGSIALAPTYLGGDEIERVAFVALAGGGLMDEGIYRLEDYTDTHIKTGESFHSIAYDGYSLVAGLSGSNNVWRCLEPLENSPTFYVSSSTKSPGGENSVTVRYAGANVVAGTLGNESAFSVSTDNGKSFNDISLIDTNITNIEDMAVSADGGKAYFLSDDGSDLSLFRKIGQTWERVLSLKGKTGFIVRLAPGNADVVYVAQPAATSLYYSNEGGDAKWYNRSSRYQIQDIAVESDDVAYLAAFNTDTVSKTTNSGFTWAIAEDTDMVAGTIYSITCLAEDQVVVAGTSGYVSYSTDGNDSWNRILQPIYPDGPATQTVVTADGLQTGNFVYAGSRSRSEIRRWTIGQDQTVPWEDLEVPTTFAAPAGVTPGNQVIYGINLTKGVLYASTSSATSTSDSAAYSYVLRTLVPGIDEPNARYWSTIGALDDDFSPDANLALSVYGTTTTPTNLVVSATPAFTKLWVISIDNPANAAPPGGNQKDEIQSFMDMLSLKGPALSSPSDETQVRVNPISGLVSDVSFTWQRPSEAIQYDVWVAFDAEFDEVATKAQSDVTTDATVSLIVGPGGNAANNALLNYILGTTYYWRVRTSAAGPVYSPWSEVRTFTVEAGSAVSPSILAPANGTSISAASPAFSWSPVSGATMYEFQLAADTSFASPIAASKQAATGIKPTATLEAGKTYFWRVRSIEPIMGDWSAVANFTVAAPPPAEKPPVVVEQVPPPVINIPAPPPAQEIVIPPAPAPVQPISSGLLWVVIIIGAILVIAVIVLIVRTRRTV